MGSPASFRERFGDVRILWQTRLGGYCLGLDEFAPIAAVPTLDDGRDFDVIAHETGIRFYSHERTCGRREALDDWGIDKVIGSVGWDVTADFERVPRNRWIAVCPYPGRTLPELSAEAGIPCHCLDWDVFWQFSDKANLRSTLSELGLPVLPGRWLKLSGARYAELASEFGHRFVVQLALGAAGAGTAMVSSETDILAAGSRFGSADVLVTPYAGRLSFNINAVATGDGTAVGYPSVQLVGIPVLGAHEGEHCGNDFSATNALPRSLVESVRDQTARIGGWMAARGYGGLFGLDFVVSEASGQACAVDLNPRWQGSTSLQTQSERMQGRIPLAAAELAWRLGVMDSAEIMRMADSFFEPIQGSQVFPKNRAPGYWKATGGLDPGIHTLGVKLSRPALRLHDLASPDETLLTSGLPHQNRPMAPHVTLLRISNTGPALDLVSGEPLRWVTEAARGVYDALALEPAD